MPTRIAAATDKLGCTPRRPRALLPLMVTALMMALLLTTSPLYVTIIRAESVAGGADAGWGAEGDAGPLTALQHAQLEQLELRKDTVLSRRRRYLVFPQDSSLNLGELVVVVFVFARVIRARTAEQCAHLYEECGALERSLLCAHTHTHINHVLIKLYARASWTFQTNSL